MTALINMTGRRFGRWLVSSRAANNAGGKAMWACACECGAASVVSGCDLRSGKSVSCGCFRDEVAAAVNATHGHSLNRRPTPELTAWKNMRRRCVSQRAHEKAIYWDRGIKVCERWESSFEAFLEDMGPRPSPRHSIDRIENAKGYEPSNCRWAPPETQAGNRDYCIMLAVNGEAMNLAAALRATGSTLSRSSIKKRLRKGWEPMAALLTPAGAIPKAA